MGARLVTAGEGDDTFDTLMLMRTHGLRRIPVVTPKGDLAGIVTADDLLAIIAEELGEIVGAVDRQPSREAVRGGGT
jgi:CBS domain-containing protein